MVKSFYKDKVWSAWRHAEQGRNDLASLKKSNKLVKSFEDYYGGKYARVSATYNNSDDPVTISVTGAGSSSAYIFTVGDVIKNARTGENLLVATIASATTITATRAFGTTAAAAGAAGDGLFIIGSVSEENAGARNANATQSTPITNYTRLFLTQSNLTLNVV